MMNECNFLSAGRRSIDANIEGLVLKTNKKKSSFDCLLGQGWIHEFPLLFAAPSKDRTHHSVLYIWVGSWLTCPRTHGSIGRHDIAALPHCYLLAERGLLRRCGATSTSWPQFKVHQNSPRFVDIGQVVLHVVLASQ